MANVPASVRQRLLNLSKEQNRPFQEVLQFYAIERFLYRLSQSEYAASFVLKGALMLQVWEAPQARPTRDIDMLGQSDNDPGILQERIRRILEADVLDDGLSFDPESLQAERIAADAEYEGVRILCNAELARARVRLQLDIGFGDVVLPEPRHMPYPAMLDFPAPELMCYSRESVIAEKFQAMVSLGEVNTRMKDFYDIWLLARQFGFEQVALSEAINATFRRRGTPLPGRPLFSHRFAADKQQQWEAFLDRLGGGVPAELDFASVLTDLAQFLGDAVDTPGKRDGALYWPAGGPWRPGETDVD